MHFTNFATSFGYGKIAFMEAIEGSENLVRFLIHLDGETFNFSTGYDVLDEIFTSERIVWSGVYWAIAVLQLGSPLRDPKAYTKAFARRLKQTFIREEITRGWEKFEASQIPDLDRDFEREEREEEEYDPYGFYEKEPVEVNLGGDPGGFKIYE